ncbi:MAG: PKD domain-containing protein, partial [Phycisphaerae bacterium]
HTVTFKHDLSSDPLGAALNFVWDFGDGSVSFETDNLDAVVTHTYTQPRTVPYQATLTVINIFGLSDTVTLPVTVTAAESPNARLDAAPRSGEAPLTVVFDAAQTTDPNPGTESLDYVWDFGDGTAISTQERVSHTYTEPGIFVARLTVTNRPYGQSASQSVEIRVGGSVDSNLPPVAAIDVDRTLGAAPLNIKFNADRSIDPEGGVLDFTWDFGDGSSLVRGVSSTEHTFQSVGTFTVTLTAEDVLGQVDTASIAVTVTGDPATRNQAPVARISTNSRQGSAPFTATFDARDSRDPEDGSNLTYEWNFDDPDSDDNTATGSVVTHTFEKPQAYDVVLRVFDSGGASGAETVRILVNANASQGQGGQDNPGTDPDVLTPACGAGCGPMGLMPMALMLIGVSGMRLSVKRRFR